MWWPVLLAADAAAVKLWQHTVLWDWVSENWLWWSPTSNGTAVIQC